MNLLRLSRRFHAVAVLAVALAAASCCHKDDPDPYNRNVLIFYECGFNDLYSYLSANMDRQLIRGYTTSDIEKKVPKSFIPGKNGNVVLIYSKIAKNTRYEPVESTLKRIYVSKGNLVTEVLRTFDSSVSACDPSTMREVMNYAKEQFPAKGYGLVFSSHGSGWLPEGYYYSPSKFEREHAGELPASARRAPGKTWNIPVERIEDDPYRHMVRSVGEELSAGGGRSQMSIEEFASGIHYHLDYILFDMCFSGGVELAYGLKDKADYIIGSPAEVLADGMFDYSTLLRYLLYGSSADLPGLARNSFLMYDTVSNVTYRSATVSLIKTSGLERLASVCKDLSGRYSSSIAAVSPGKVQGFFRLGRHYFYDLKDIFEKSGVSSGDLDVLQGALDACLPYKAATPSFLSEFDIRTCCGLTMYLPSNGTPLLDKYYRKEAWNDATGLVQ